MLVVTLFALMQQEKCAASSKLISSTSSVIFRSSFSKAWTSFSTVTSDEASIKIAEKVSLALSKFYSILQV